MTATATLPAEPPRAAGRSLNEFEPLLSCETALKDKVQAGEALTLGDGILPAAGDAERRIRGRFLRFLVLGGDTAAVVHENGIDLTGAWIDGAVALDNVAGKVFVGLTRCRLDTLTATDAELPLLALAGCHVAGAVNAARLACAAGLYWQGLVAGGVVTLDDARIGLLQLDGARLAFGLRAQRLVCAGGVYLRAGFRADGPVDLTLVVAGNDLDCTGGTFVNPLFVTGDAAGAAVARPVAADAAAEAAARAAVVTALAARLAVAARFDTGPQASDEEIAKAAAAMLYAAPLESDGTRRAAAAIELSGATVKGNLFLNQATVLGRIGATVAHIGLLTADGARLIDRDGCALDLGGATVERALRVYAAAEVAGTIILRTATAGTLQVEASPRWAGTARFALDGFVYARLDIEGDAPRYSDWAARWIRGPEPAVAGGEFRPQPWDQLITALRASGHPLDATRLAITKEDDYRSAGKVEGRARRALHVLHGALVGYGYKPEWLVGWLALVWLAAGLVFAALGPIAVDGLLVPAKSAIASNCLVDRIVAGDRRPCPARRDDPVFLPWSYSADLLIPGLHLGDADEWKLDWHQPDPWRVLRFGGVVVLFVTKWFVQLFGGAGFSVLAVVVGGYLLKRRD